MRDSLDELFAGVDAGRLPSLPHVLVKLLDITFTEVVAFDTLSELIKQDAGLTARVTAAANTAYYAGQGKDLEFERVLVLLGMDTIKTISITACVQQFFSRFETASARRLKQFWRNSLTCALISKRLAHLIGYHCQEEAYLAGLLHNVGELIFESHYPEQHEQICNEATDQLSKLKLEQAHIGANHFQAGAWLVNSWGLESFMEDAILFQGEAVNEIREAHNLVKLVYLANQMSQQYGSLSDDAFLCAKSLFDLEHGILEQITAEVAEEVVAAASALNIDIGQADGQVGDEDSLDMQVELADRVRNVAYLSSFKAMPAASAGTDSSEQTVLLRLQQSLNILFGVRNSLFLLPNAAGDALAGRSVADQYPQLAEFSVAMDGHSLAVRALNTRELASSFTSSETVAVIDRQLAKMMGADGLLCLPLFQGEQPVGVWVMSIDAAQHERFSQQARLLNLLAQEAAIALVQQRDSAVQSQQQQQEDQSYFHSRAREVVHEVNNPLSIVKNYVHLLSHRLAEDEAAVADLEIIREELERAGSLLLRLPGIADQGLLGVSDDQVNINDLVNDLIRVFKGSLFHTYRVESFTDLDDTVVSIATDRSAIKQILTNLVKNAAEALPEGGRITVSTRGLVNHNGKNYVAIVVADNGGGIPVHIQEKLFTPVATTKGEGHAGLGLSIVKNLLTEMGGSISCRSNAKDGTRFELLIPRTVES